MTFTYNVSDELRRKLRKIGKKDTQLAQNIKRKIKEICSRDAKSIDAYKNLKSPQQHLKRIHLTTSHILLFTADKERNHVLFVDIAHRDRAYKP